MVFAATAAVSEPRSWDGIWALILGALGAAVVCWFWRRWREASPSPTAALPAGSRPKVQATVGVNTGVKEFGWGRISYEGKRALAQAKQIVTTGSHELPPADEDDIDVPLDDVDGEPSDVSEGESLGIEDMDSYIRRELDAEAPYMNIVRACMKYYGVSDATAKRHIRDVREARASARPQ